MALELSELLLFNYQDIFFYCYFKNKTSCLQMIKDSYMFIQLK